MTPAMNKASARYLYFIPGNPGLVAFYRPFLHHLAAQLQDIQVIAHSGPGFHGSYTKGPTSLQEQIAFHQARLEDCPGNVFLVGHSVGAFMALQILQNPRNLHIIAILLLFPTIEFIAESPNGRLLSPFLRLPGFPRATELAARFLCRLLPLNHLAGLLSWCTGLQEHALDALLTFLQSPHGVRQALYLAADEMRLIKTLTLPKQDNMYFLWGQIDGWVVSSRRDSLFRRGLPMELAKSGIPHSFCLSKGDSGHENRPLIPEHSREVANLVVHYIRGISLPDETVLKPH